MKKLSLSLVLAFLLLATLGYAQSGDPAENPTLAQSAGSTLNPTNLNNNNLPSLVGYCSYYQVYPIPGTTRANLICTSSEINAGSSVFASVSQTNSQGIRVLGNPVMWVENIVPLNGEVKVRVDLGSDGPINVRLDLSVAQ